MSKAEELANSVEMHIPCRRTLGHGESCITGRLCDSCERNTRLSAHLRALEANRQMLVNELEWIRGHIGRYDQPGLPNHIVRRINTALEQAKELI